MICLIPEKNFMRVNSYTSHCPVFCFSKPPPPPSQAASYYQPYPLEFENAHDISCRSSPVSLVAEQKLCGEKVEADEKGVDDGNFELLLKSCLKKTMNPASKETRKESVKWMDDLGKELAEIREFEPIESAEFDEELNGYPTCACVLM